MRLSPESWTTVTACSLGSKWAVRQLQYIQNAAARVLTRTRKYDHISPVLRSLYWLLVAQRIDFKTVLLV